MFVLPFSFVDEVIKLAQSAPAAPAVEAPKPKPKADKKPEPPPTPSGTGPGMLPHGMSPSMANTINRVRQERADRGEAPYVPVQAGQAAPMSPGMAKMINQARIRETATGAAYRGPVESYPQAAGRMAAEASQAKKPVAKKPAPTAVAQAPAVAPKVNRPVDAAAAQSAARTEALRARIAARTAELTQRAATGPATAPQPVPAAPMPQPVPEGPPPAPMPQPQVAQGTPPPAPMPQPRANTAQPAAPQRRVMSQDERDQSALAASMNISDYQNQRMQYWLSQGLSRNAASARSFMDANRYSPVTVAPSPNSPNRVQVPAAAQAWLANQGLTMQQAVSLPGDDPRRNEFLSMLQSATQQ